MNAVTNMPKPKIVNGLNVYDIMALVGEVTKDPKKGMTTWHVATSWMGQARSRSEVTGFVIGGTHVERRFTLEADEPVEIGGTNTRANPQEYLLAALNACMTVGYVAQCAVRGIMLEKLEIETTGDIDLRGFLGVDPAVAPGYESLRYTVRIKGSATKEQFAEIHQAVMATSPNFHNLARPVALKAALVVVD